MTKKSILKQLKPWRDHAMRQAWRPITAEGEGEGAGSKFAGAAWLAAGADWPACPTCRAAMPLFLQLNLAQLPPALAETYGRGLIQLFYCTDCDEGWEAFSTTSLVRLIDPAGGASAAPPAGSFPALAITAWEALEDYPNPQDHDQLGLSYDYHAGPPPRISVSCPAFGVALDVIGDDELEGNISSAAPGDKLAGWPLWIQGPEYPDCPECHRQMRLVFQFDSEDHLPFTFGDAGTGHITQCPEHTAVLAFGWACT